MVWVTNGLHFEEAVEVCVKSPNWKAVVRWNKVKIVFLSGGVTVGTFCTVVRKYCLEAKMFCQCRKASSVTWDTIFSGSEDLRCIMLPCSV